MSNLSINSSAPCYHLDLSAKKAAFGKYDYSKLVAQQAKMAEDERNNPQIGTATLTEQEVQDLAAKYDPTNMTNAEYNSFINDLVNKGVLGRSETYGIYSDRVVLRPGHLSEGGISSSPVRTLADMGGDALQWTSIMSQWRGGSFDTIRADAFQKISGILGEMNTHRLEQEKATEDAAKADEQLAAMDRAIYEQKKNIDSAEARSATEHKALIEALNNAAIEGTSATEPQEILDRLSDPAKATLEAIRADEEVSQEEWLGLLGELRDTGAISDTEFTYSRGDLRLIPLGYTDENGVFVRYESAGRFAEARLLQLAGLETSEEAVVDWDWNNDPLAYLDNWIAELTEWRDDLSQERSASGAPKYDNFSPIDNQVAACTKVSELVKGLVAQTE